MPDLLRTKELGELLGVKEQTVRNYVQRGMPVHSTDTLGRWYDASACVAWVKANPHSGSGGKRANAGRTPASPEARQMRARIDDAHTVEMVHQQIEQDLIPPGADKLHDLLNYTAQQLEAVCRVYPPGHTRLNKAQVDLLNALLEAQRRSMAIAVEAGDLVAVSAVVEAIGEQVTQTRRMLDELASRTARCVVEALESAALLTERAAIGNAAEAIVRDAVARSVIAIQQQMTDALEPMARKIGE